MKSELALALLSACICVCAHGNDLGNDPNGDLYTGPADQDGATVQSEQAGCPIVINEVLAHAHAEAPDWIELYNTGSSPVNIGGWMLSDREDNLGKFQIAAGTVVRPFGYLVFYENTHFGNPKNPGAHIPFALTENGETLYLFSGADRVFPGCLAEALLGPSETSYSFGRYRTSFGVYRYVTMSKPTPGQKNAYPRVGPVIINEVMYHPVNDADMEYVELLNVSDGPVTLFDFVEKKPWQFTDYSGIEYRFATDNPVVLNKGERLLLVKNASAVRKQYKIPAGVRVMQWDSGKLDNAGEQLYLLKPGDVDAAGTRYWIEVDSLDYSDGHHPKDFPKKVDPWPAAADGSGASLSRLEPGKYGNDPNNWQALAPTPGSLND